MPVVGRPDWVRPGALVSYTSLGPADPPHVFTGRILQVYTHPRGDMALIDDHPVRQPRMVGTGRLRPAPASARSTHLGGCA